MISDGHVGSSRFSAPASLPPPPVEMSAHVGGRAFHPALPVVDGSWPTLKEEQFQQSLQLYIDSNIPIESKAGIERRERVLNRLGTLCRDWIRTVCTRRGLPADVIDAAGGQLFTSGSYRLGVHEPGADIDTILVAPHMCRRQDFFGTLSTSATSDDVVIRDPHSLAERIRKHPDVTNFVPVEGAAVPILTFDWEGVNIDLLFGRLHSNSVPDNFDIDADAVLDGADSATEKSLNGPRVTNLLSKLVSGTPERYQTFLTVVRCIRKWAKARGLYSNKMGYWGGVNINIGVAFTIQLYPNACPASLLRKFFLVFKTWRWPQPIMLTKPHDAGYGLPVWNPQLAMAPHMSRQPQVAPMITPAYPAMNSTLSVSRQTLQILQEEFNRGHAIVDDLWKQCQKNPTHPLDWQKLFEPSDFFISYPTYLSCCIVGPTQTDAQAWSGFVESRLRKLVSDNLGRSLPLRKIQMWPKKFESCVADKSALLTQAQRQNCLTYFIGFQVDKLRMRGSELNVEFQLQKFREWDLARFQPLLPGMDILFLSFNVKELPLICFDGIYPGGKIEAMKKRRKIRDEDPERQEARNKKRLEQLKLQMAEIQRKKDAVSKKAKIESNLDDGGDFIDDADAMNRKRKRDETATVNDHDGITNIDGDTRKTTSSGEAFVNDETNLLESALDTIEGTTNEMISREQAASDREKLLAGELLVAGNGASDALDPSADVLLDEDAEDIGYAGEGARQMFYNRTQQVMAPSRGKYKRCLPIPEEDEDILKKLGYHITGDDDLQVLGPVPSPGYVPLENEVDPENNTKRVRPRMKIIFHSPFDIVELDAVGRVIDRGDDDFAPSRTWTGRKAGFEFKLGARGMGYYRTGKEVVIPSKTAYFIK